MQWDQLMVIRVDERGECKHRGATQQDVWISRRMTMPDKRTIAKAKRDRRRGRSPSTQAGEFVRAEMDKIRRGEHGARSARQAVAIGLSEARRAGVKLPPPRRGRAKG